MPNTPLIPPRVPLTDPRTGTIAREWYHYLMDQHTLTGGSPITRVNDSNVTLTIGGSPSIAALAPVSFTLGWSGYLPINRGGTGADTEAGALAALGGASETYVDDGDAATLSSANSHADTGDEATLAAANAYTDSAVASITGSAFSPDDIVTVPDGDTFALVFTESGNVVALT